MAITFSPSNLELMEFTGTAGTTVTMTYDAGAPGATGSPTPSPAISSVTVTSGNAPSDLVITYTDSSFTFSSAFNNMFSKTIKYLIQDADATKHYYAVNSFSSLPSTFTGVYQYVPPPTITMDIDFEVVVTGLLGADETETWTLVLRYDSASANTALTAAIADGEISKLAVINYPELSP